MKFEEFVQAVNSTECCATCKFFDNTDGHAYAYHSGGEVKSWSVLGTCRRYPPVMARERKGYGTNEREEEFGCPSIYVRASKTHEGQTKIGSDYSHGFGNDETPWCGEYKHGIKHPFIDTEKIYKKAPGLHESNLDKDE